VDSIRLLEEIDKQGVKLGRVIPCLAQIFIAREETKFGFDEEDFVTFVESASWKEMKHVKLTGLMGMATLTENENHVREAFKSLKRFFDALKSKTLPEDVEMKDLSMG